jgi:hypothetical protein
MMNLVGDHMCPPDLFGLAIPASSIASLEQGTSPLPAFSNYLIAIKVRHMVTITAETDFARG